MFDQLLQILEELLIVNREAPFVVLHPVVLDLVLVTHAESVIPGEVRRLPHQEQPVGPGLEEVLGLLARYLAVEPSVERRPFIGRNGGRTDTYGIELNFASRFTFS